MGQASGAVFDADAPSGGGRRLRKPPPSGGLLQIEDRGEASIGAVCSRDSIT